MLDTINSKTAAMFVAAQTFINTRREQSQNEEGLAVVEIVIILAIVAAATIAIVVGIMALTEGRAAEIKYKP